MRTYCTRLLKAAGDIMALGPIGNLTTALTSALSKLSASSSTLRALNSRLAVRVPFSSILVRDFEEELNMSAKFVAMIRNDLLVDVNRVRLCSDLHVNICDVKE